MRGGGGEHHYVALDGLRGIAALLVVVTHISTRTELQDLFRIYGLGQVGVMLFFALSGFLMMHVTNGRSCRYHLRNFLVRRISRVFPLYAFVVVLAFCTSFVLVDGRSLSVFGIRGFGDVVEHLALLKGNGVLWTISIEIFFYFLFPLFWWAKDKSWAHFYVLLISVFVIQQMAYFVGGWGEMDLAFLGIIPRGHMFLLGMAVYPLVGLITEKHVVFDVLFVLSIILVALNLEDVSGALFGYSIYIWKNPVVLVLLCVILALCVSVKKVGVILDNRASVFIGKISYSLYLMHIFILQVLKWYTDWEVDDRLLYWAACLVLSLAVSCLTYRFIERPFRSALNSRFCTPYQTAPV
ncbi:acyltransferase family protein [Halomonas organivorans]|uniref:Peptidoglycan/LPS O-acetylase OafA/YrhL n=1 Tax=Halomonas organivorans TaxID=257772 RepID=A0A7W5G814_9GAMM|nr:acyltransferase [Halomonas organivorans]MBB3143492.1 peptidoglycan/LPS O-acetylase OafA/YrhL [Halomonas organivorans]